MLAEAETLIDMEDDDEAVAQRVGAAVEEPLVVVLAQRVSEAVDEPLVVVLAQRVSEAVDEPLAVVLPHSVGLGELVCAFDIEGSNDGVDGGEDAIGVAVGARDELPVGVWE